MAEVADDNAPTGPGAVLSFLREGAPSSVSEMPVDLPVLGQQTGAAAAAAQQQGLSARCAAFVDWLDQRGFQVVVFDMDRTMSSGHCGQGLKREDLQGYLNSVSRDFVEASLALSSLGRHKLAVATGSDPLEYDIPGQGRDTHILGPDLATEVIRYWCVEALPQFEVILGYDCELHGGAAENKGKRFHMRVISQHYGVPMQNMVLFDDSQGCLENEEGWTGIKVKDSIGFRFEDCFDA
mmetsp:Transcript_40078/g.98498  ORF Transcript_40078/g.98498 Transcript_40078/m.98498 type:complete len:238 (+) Transcript_40078:169-882(+)